ncbi:MAG: tyrosine-type recombinase/integrase [Solirubrobacteraceae bacterium]
MAKSSKPRRVRVERNVYRTESGSYEVGFRDGTGRQRWRRVQGGITAARAARDELLARRGRGEPVQPTDRLRFAEAAQRWLGGPVMTLRPRTQECYRNAASRHLLPRLGSRRLDAITPDDLAHLVGELRAGGLSESTIVIVLGVVNRLYRFAARRLGWSGPNPVSLMLSSERPKPSAGKRRRIFEGAELEQTIAAADEPYRTLFTLAALAGARLSELLGLTWANVALADLDDAEIEFALQVDRHGARVATKTDGSARTVPVPRELALILTRHKLASSFPGDDHYVFCTRTGRPFGQRNVGRALRIAQRKARNRDGEPTFPILHARDEAGAAVAVPHGVLPSMHSFRHTVAGRALLAGESVDEVAFLLGHRNANVTRAVYVRELADVRRRAMRRSRMVAEFSDLLKSCDTGDGSCRPGG